MALKKGIVKIAAPFVIKGISSVCAHDLKGKRECSKWPKELYFAMKVSTESDLLIAFQKTQGKIKKVGYNHEPKGTKIEVVFKDLNYLFRIMTGRYSAYTAFAESRLFVYGDLRLLVSILTVIDQLFTYLIPKFMLKKLYIRCPQAKGHKGKVLQHTILK